MRIRGERACRNCGTHWSYFETGAIECPDCGSLASAGRSEPAEHTDGAVELDLSSSRQALADRPLEAVTGDIRETCRSYLQGRGFIREGVIQPLDDAFLRAAELKQVCHALERTQTVEEECELYFLQLLRSEERPGPERVPGALQEARAAGFADALERYCRDLRRYARWNQATSEQRAAIESLEAHTRRLALLEGRVDPVQVESLVRAARDVADGLTGNETALATGRRRLEDRTTLG